MVGQREKEPELHAISVGGVHSVRNRLSPERSDRRHSVFMGETDNQAGSQQTVEPALHHSTRDGQYRSACSDGRSCTVNNGSKLPPSGQLFSNQSREKAHRQPCRQQVTMQAITQSEQPADEERTPYSTKDALNWYVEGHDPSVVSGRQFEMIAEPGEGTRTKRV